jgi:hypothetical protein
MNKEDCAVCRLIRVYLLFAVPLLALVGASTMEGGEKARLWVARVELIDILAWGALVALLAITSYRAYEEFYLPRRRLRALEAVKQSLESLPEDDESSGNAVGATPPKEDER